MDYDKLYKNIKNKDLDKVKEQIEPSMKSLHLLNNILKKSAECHSNNIFKYIMETFYQFPIHAHNHLILQIACENKNIEIIEYIFSLNPKNLDKERLQIHLIRQVLGDYDNYTNAQYNVAEYFILKFKNHDLYLKYINHFPEVYQNSIKNKFFQ